MTDFSNMKNKPETPKVGVGVVIMDNSYEVLLGVRRGSHGEGQWALPGGHLEIGENFSDACIREVKEETGIDVENLMQLYFHNNIMEDEGLHYVTLFFLALVDNVDAKLMEPDKCEGWAWFSRDNIPDDLFDAAGIAIDGAYEYIDSLSYYGVGE